MSYHVDSNGYYGEFGGAYIPEMLYPNVEELRGQYLQLTAEESFQKEFHRLLRDYVGRPSPLYHAPRLTRSYGGAKIYLKREDLLHGGAHKTNQVIGQALVDGEEIVIVVAEHGAARQQGDVVVRRERLDRPPDPVLGRRQNRGHRSPDQKAHGND